MRLYKFKALALSITILIGTWLNTIRHMCTMSKVSHKKNNINKEKNLVWTIFHFLFSYNKSMKIILYQKKKKRSIRISVPTLYCLVPLHCHVKHTDKLILIWWFSSLRTLWYTKIQVYFSFGRRKKKSVHVFANATCELYIYDAQ